MRPARLPAVLALLALLALLVATACAPAGARSGVDASGEGHGRPHPDVDSARELDQAGVHAFREGRFADAIRYFRAAYRLGGPPSELWNVARSRERLDDAEGATAAIDEYLAQGGLTPADRAEAEREGRALRSRPSTLTVTTRPPGAVITIDGKQTVGPTPVSVEVPVGAHTLAVRRSGYLATTRPFEARFGRAVIVSLDLALEGK